MRQWAICLALCGLMMSALYAAETVPRKKAVTLEASDEGAAPPPPTVPVSVMNFPAVQPVVGTVSIDNLPATQQVSGAVSVDNFPAVQPVEGNVSVGNLPFAENGSLRVSDEPGAVSRAIELLAEPVTMDSAQFVTDVVDVSGYEFVGILVQGSRNLEVEARWKWLDDEPFASTMDMRDSARCATNYNQYRLVCHTSGPKLVVFLQNPQGSAGTTLFSIRVQLFNRI